MATTQLPPAGPPQDQNPTWPPQQPPQSPPPPYWGPPQPPQQGPPKPHTARNIWLICGAAAITGAIIGGGIASGQSHPAAASTPPPVSTSQPAAPASQPAPAATVPDAQSVLTADGYTTDDVNESQSQITSTFGSAAPYITSAADGSNGTDVEVVIIETGAGVTVMGGPSALQSDLQAAFPQATVTVTPDSDGSYTIRVVESISAAASS